METDNVKKIVAVTAAMLCAGTTYADRLKQGPIETGAQLRRSAVLMATYLKASLAVCEWSSMVTTVVHEYERAVEIASRYQNVPMEVVYERVVKDSATMVTALDQIGPIPIEEFCIEMNKAMGYADGAAGPKKSG